MFIQRLGYPDGTQDVYTLIGKIVWELAQRGVFVSDLTRSEAQALILYAGNPEKSWESSADALERLVRARKGLPSTSTPEASTSGGTSSTTPRWVDVPLF